MDLGYRNAQALRILTDAWVTLFKSNPLCQKHPLVVTLCSLIGLKVDIVRREGGTITSKMTLLVGIALGIVFNKNAENT